MSASTLSSALAVAVAILLWVMLRFGLLLHRHARAKACIARLRTERNIAQHEVWQLRLALSRDPVGRMPEAGPDLSAFWVDTK